MARFDVYRHPDAKQRVTTPFLLDVQNEYISGLQTRVVLPLRRAERVAIPLRDLNPALEVEGVAVILDAAAIGAVPLSMLKSPVGNLRAQADLIISAMEAAIQSKRVTYDFARLMDGATQVSCSGFGDEMIRHM